MKTVAILSLLLLASSAFGELTKEDIRTIVKEENAASEKRMKEYIDLKIDATNARIDAVEKNLNARIDAVEKNLNVRIDALDQKIDDLDENLTDRIGDIWLLVLALIGLIAAAIAIPQIVIAYRDRSQKDIEKRQEDLQTEIRQLREKIEAMQSTPS